jgi:hypothetical protein
MASQQPQPGAKQASLVEAVRSDYRAAETLPPAVQSMAEAFKGQRAYSYEAAQSEEDGEPEEYPSDDDLVFGGDYSSEDPKEAPATFDIESIPEDAREPRTTHTQEMKLRHKEQQGQIHPQLAQRRAALEALRRRAAQTPSARVRANEHGYPDQADVAALQVRLGRTAAEAARVNTGGPLEVTETEVRGPPLDDGDEDGFAQG